MEVGSFPKRREREGMNSQSYRDVCMRFLKASPNIKRVGASDLEFSGRLMSTRNAPN